MKVHKNGNKTIIIWSNENHSFEEFAKWAQGYLEQQKQKLTKEEWLILNAEDAIKDQEADAPYNDCRMWWARAWAFNTVKNGELQDFLPDLHSILNLFYKRVINYIEERTGAWITDKMTEKIKKRREEITSAVLQQIEDSKAYENKKEEYKYDCSPVTIIALVRWEKTYITHIFKPQLDMNVIANVMYAGGWWERIYLIEISKDVFTWFTKEQKKNDNYLAQQLGYKTKDELFQAMKDNNLNNKWKETLFLGENIKRLRDDTN